MRRALLHPLCCLAACMAVLYLMRREFGVPSSCLPLGLFLAGCGYVCSLTLIPWMCFSDWGRHMRKKKMGDPEVLGDPILFQMMSYMPRYVLVSVAGAVADLWASSAVIAGVSAVIFSATATHASWSVMRWTPDPT